MKTGVNRKSDEKVAFAGGGRNPPGKDKAAVFVHRKITPHSENRTGSLFYVFPFYR